MPRETPLTYVAHLAIRLLGINGRNGMLFMFGFFLYLVITQNEVAVL